MKPERWKKVESIFHKALAADENRRGSVIEESCAGDEELRREVESLLAHHTDTASFIEKPASPARAPPPTFASVAPVSRPDLNGVEFGQYRVLEEIGFGGMGVVYKAEDTSSAAWWRSSFCRSTWPRTRLRWNVSPRSS